MFTFYQQHPKLSMKMINPFISFYQAFFSHTQSTFITHPLVILHDNYSRKPQRVKLMGEANALYYAWVLPPI